MNDQFEIYFGNSVGECAINMFKDIRRDRVELGVRGVGNYFKYFLNLKNS